MINLELEKDFGVIYFFYWVHFAKELIIRAAIGCSKGVNMITKSLSTAKSTYNSRSARDQSKRL